MKNLLILALAGLLLGGCTDEDMSAVCSPGDLQCRARAFMVKADVLCKERIEKMAKSDLKWDRARNKPLLENYGWKDKPEGIIAYSGDKAKIQMPSGEYVREKYECDVNPNDKKSPIVNVKVKLEKSAAS